MKSEMFEFALHISGYGILDSDMDMFHLNQRMPHGQIVYGPKSYPKHRLPKFPGHKTYPHLDYLHPRYSPVFAAGAVVAAPPAFAVWSSAVVHVGHQKMSPGPEGSRSDNKSFWTSVSQAMTGGFGTGGWQP